VCANSRLRGKVQYGRFAQIVYDVGIKFEKPQGSDRKRFEPARLLEIPTADRRSTGGGQHLTGAVRRRANPQAKVQ